MDDDVRLMLFITALIAAGGLAYLIAKMSSIELRLATQKPQVVYVQPASTGTENVVAEFLPNGASYIA